MLYMGASMLGYLSVAFYFLAISNYIIKALNRRYRERIRDSKRLHGVSMWGMKHVVKNHRLFGMLTFVCFLAHSLAQFFLFGYNPTGVIAAALLLAQIGLGWHGFSSKRKMSHWLPVHRGVAVLLFFSVILHSLFT